MIALRQFLQFLLRLLVLSLLLAGAHYLLYIATSLTPSLQDVFSMHVFVVLLTAVGFAILTYFGSKGPNKVGFAFLGLVVIKMMVSFAFLYAYLKSPGPGVNVLVLNFFAIYFLYLAFEVKEVYALIKSEQPAAGE